jgi:O-antigen/teichoic acid export membrane protein
MRALPEAKRLILLFRLHPFDTSTVAGRSMERYRRVVLTTMSACLAKVIVALTLLVSVPLTLSYLGPERYGLWMTVGSFIAILSFSDFGIGNGLVNAVSEANGKDDQELARRYVSSAFFMLSGVSLLLLIIFAVVYRWVPWYRLFNVHSATAIAESGPAMAIFFGCFLVNIPLGTVNRIQSGYQQGFANNLWMALGSLLALGAVVLACKLRAGRPWLVLAMTGAPALATLLNACVVFGVQRPWLLPSLRYADFGAGGKLFRLGMMFFVLQIANALAFSSDNIVVAQILGPSAVTQYSVPARMFSIITMLIYTALASLWPAYGEALARQEFDWIRRTLRRSIGVGLAIAIPANLFLVLFASKLLHFWVGSKVAPTFLLLTGFALWGIVTAINNPLNTFFNGMSEVKFLVILSVLAAPTNLALSIFLTRHLGIPGPVWGSVISNTIIVLLPCAIFVPRLLRSRTLSVTETFRNLYRVKV